MRESSLKSIDEAKNLLFFTVEFPPVQSGGLWIVSEGVPMALNKYGGKDTRVVVPYYDAFHKSANWTDTGERIHVQLPGISSGEQTFQVFQNYNEAIQNYTYGLAHDGIRDLGDIYPSFASGGTCEAALVRHKRPNGELELSDLSSFSHLMLFNHAALALARTLNGPEDPRFSADENSKTLARFSGPVDVWVLNDWMTAPLASLGKNEGVGTLFVLHNIYDNQQYEEAAAAFGLPADCEASPLNALKDADTLVVNANFYNTLTRTRFLDVQNMNTIKQSLESKRATIFDVHHGIGKEFDPHKSRALVAAKGFSELKRVNGEAGWEAIIRYKQKNRWALQRLLGLEKNEDSILYCWTNRLDRVQKGLDLVIGEFASFMKDNPAVQFVMLSRSTNDDPTIARFISTMKVRFKHRFRFLEFNYSLQPLINAGSDFSLMPSVYEPYGLAQLQAMKLGCIPVAHAVDGLRTTLSDPKQNSLYPGEPEEAWHFGQTAVLMDPFPVADFLGAVSRLKLTEQSLDHELDESQRQLLLSTRKNELHAWTEARKSFSEALARSLRLAEDRRKTATIAYRAMRYVEKRHSWKAVAALYDSPLRHAASSRRATTTEIGNLDPSPIAKRTYRSGT